jgi:ABC-type glycerol-3-phosphate transport system substrate-binding protein
MPKKSALISTLIASSLVLAGCATTPTQTQDETSTPTAEPTQSPTPTASESEESVEDAKPEIKATMTDIEIVLAALMGPDGEYAAAASYEAVLNEYGSVEPYATIYQAELRHISALARQLERLGEPVPANPYTGKITAPKDLVTAAEAWAEGEVLNVELYDNLISKTDNANLLKVLGNLRRASLESHLPAFELAAENGGTLTAEQMAGR